MGDADAFDDLADAILYRLAHGLASSRLDAERFGRTYTRDAAAQFRRLEAEVARQLGPRAGPAREVIREAVADAEGGRRPRW